MSRYFSLNVWTPYITRNGGDVWLLGLNFDWLHDHELTQPGSVSVTAYLLGFGLCLTYWPRGKA